MFRDDKEMTVRDAKCLDIVGAFGRAGVRARWNRMAAMPTSSVVAWSACGPRRQRRAVATVDDSGECRVFLSAARDVPEGKSGEDWLCCLAMPLLCSLSAGTPDLGDEILRRLRGADDGDGGPRAPWSDPAALTAAQDEDEHEDAETSATADTWARGDPFAQDEFTDDGNRLVPDDGPIPAQAPSPTPAPWRARSIAFDELRIGEGARGPSPWRWRAPGGPRRDAGRARAVALMLPVAVSVTISGCLAEAGPPPEPAADPEPAATDHREHLDAPMSALSFGPGPPAADVVSRWHRRDPLQGPND